VNYDNDSNVTAKNEEGKQIDVTVADNLTSDEKTELESVLPSDTTDVQVLSLSGSAVSGGKKIALSYAVVNGKSVVTAAYVQNAEGKWEKVESSYNDGTVTLTLDGVGAVTLDNVDLKTDPTEPTPENPGNTEKGDGEKNTAGAQTPAKGKSPQTGYDVLGWAVAVSALVMAAGYCFVSARKVTE
jgi:hypothetical protein